MSFMSSPVNRFLAEDFSKVSKLTKASSGYRNFRKFQKLSKASEGYENFPKIFRKLFGNQCKNFRRVTENFRNNQKLPMITEKFSENFRNRQKLPRVTKNSRRFSDNFENRQKLLKGTKNFPKVLKDFTKIRLLYLSNRRGLKIFISIYCVEYKQASLAALSRKILFLSLTFYHFTPPSNILSVLVANRFLP